MEFERLRRICAIALISAAAACADAAAQQVRGIQARFTQPIAPRGGVLMLALTADRHGSRWPETLELRASDGQVITGHVAWIHPAPPRRSRQWTDDPRWLLIRGVRPDDDSAAVANDPVMGPYLLAQLPLNANGSLRLGRQTLQPIWSDIPQYSRDPDAAPVSPFATLADAPTLTLSPGPDRPDPVSPFEYWRWVLLADRMEMNPPLPFGGEIERMAAEHFAALWRIGLARLGTLSPRVAQQCRNMLTQTCIDRRQPFAAWVADPAQIGLLLTILLDSNRSNAQSLADVVAWIDHQPPLVFWPESQFGDQVILALATPRTEPVVATFTWVNTTEPPQSIRIEPGVLMQVLIDRPPLPAAPAIGFPAPAEPAHQTLSIQALGMRDEVIFGPRVLQARPPGVNFPALLPPLTLAEVQMRVQRALPVEQATFAQVRRLSGRWEVFVDCRRVRLPNEATGAALPEVLTSLTDVRGVEAVTVLLGPDDSLTPADATGAPRQPRVWLTVPESGFWRLAHGENDGTLQIHRASYADRWYCRIVLPETWFSAAETSPGYIAILRSHGDGDQVETAPGPSAPWRPSPGRAAIDLELWDDLGPAP